MKQSIDDIPMTVSGGVDEQHAQLGFQMRSERCAHTMHPEAQWFASAGLGLFIHWGIAAVHGGLDLSWSMMANTPWDAAAAGTNKITPADYWKLAERFQPEHYDPDRWIAAAARAGCQYAVLTTMHHDGYTLWPSLYGELGVQSHLRGRDLVGPFVEACRKHGLKVGLYYSPPDWFFDREYMSFNYGSDDQQRFPGRRHFDVHHQPGELPEKPPGHDARRRAIFHARVEELLTQFGRIDLLWFDGGTHDNAIRDRARQLQPHIVINSRSCDGDYNCTECSLPAQKFAGWFETCHCWQASDILAPSGNTVDFWGYLKEEQFKSSAWMLEALVRLRSWGGNLLINVGPRPNGQLPSVVYDRLAEVGQWMAHSRESVIGAEGGPYPQQSDVPVTTRGTCWYLHLLPGSSGRATLSDVDRPSEVRLLRTGQSVHYQWADRRITIAVEPEYRTSLVDVVAVRYTGD